MAIRLALLEHRHDAAWEWRDSEIDTAVDRLGRWRAAFGRDSGPDAGPLIDSMRDALRSGLDTPTAVAAVDAWASAEGDDASAPAAAANAVDALLGII